MNTTPERESAPTAPHGQGAHNPKVETMAHATASRPRRNPPNNVSSLETARARIHSRKPTGRVPWPCILIEGDEKSGKTWRSYQLSASGKLGEMFVIDLTEGSADEYGLIPGACFEILTHDGTYGSILEHVLAVKEYAREVVEAGGAPVVLVIDPISTLWERLKDWTTERAKKSQSNRNKLAADPNASIDVPRNYWNDASSRWRKLMTHLLTFPGVVILTARGRSVSGTNEKTGQPSGEKEWKVEGHTSLGFDATAWIRMRRGKTAQLIAARSVHCGLRPEEDEPRDFARNWTLEGFIFNELKLNPETAHVRDLKEVDASIDLPNDLPYQSPGEFHQRVKDAWSDIEELRRLLAEGETRGLLDVVKPHPEDDAKSAPLRQIIEERGKHLHLKGQEISARRQPATPDGTPDQIRSDIFKAGQEQGLGLDDLAAGFAEKNPGQDHIKDVTNPDLLRAYLEHLKKRVAADLAEQIKATTDANLLTELARSVAEEYGAGRITPGEMDALNKLLDVRRAELGAKQEVAA